MRTPRSAFVPAVPLALPSSPSRRVTHRCPALCAQQPRRDAASAPGPARRAAARLPAALVAAAGALLGAFSGPVSLAQIRQAGFSPLGGPVAAATAAATTTSNGASSKGLRYDGRQELDSGEKAMSMTLTLGAFAALGVWAWKQNRRDDELETVRIKDEVERLEKLRAEFVDVEEDDDSLDDEDLLASLKQRISEGDDADTDADAEGDDPATAADPVATADQPASDTEPRKNANGPTAVDSDETDPDSTAEGQSPPQPGGNPDSVDMLRRMWDATDEDTKKDKS